MQWCELKVLARRALSLNCGSVLLILCLGSDWAFAEGAEQPRSGAPVSEDLPLDVVSDARGAATKLKLQKGDFVAVPIPLSDPTFGTGLIAAGAYFYPQTEAQRLAQPASWTGVAAVYTNNRSYAFGIGQQNYWDDDTWRFNGLAGYVDFKLDLSDPAAGSDITTDWLVDGYFVQGALSRRIGGNWYLGLEGRYLDINQDLAFGPEAPDYGLGTSIQSIGAGPLLEFDTRDVPTNAFKGQRFEAKGIFSSTSGDESSDYQSYFARYRLYHQMADAIVIAFDINGCLKSGDIPLWDTCRLTLRGFPATDYLGDKSVAGQVEARWRAWKKLGFVAFAGAGYVDRSFSDNFTSERVPSYGAGIRYMVLESKRVNLRIDYARSDDDDAWYLSVGEAF